MGETLVLRVGGFQLGCVGSALWACEGNSALPSLRSDSLLHLYRAPLLASRRYSIPRRPLRRGRHRQTKTKRCLRGPSITDGLPAAYAFSHTPISRDADLLVGSPFVSCTHALLCSTYAASRATPDVGDNVVESLSVSWTKGRGKGGRGTGDGGSVPSASLRLGHPKVQRADRLD